MDVCSNMAIVDKTFSQNMFLHVILTQDDHLFYDGNHENVVCALEKYYSVNIWMALNLFAEFTYFWNIFLVTNNGYFTGPVSPILLPFFFVRNLNRLTKMNKQNNF